MRSEVEAFYDTHSQKFIKDYVKGNARVERQFEFFSDAIPRNIGKILIVGCGSGEGSHFIANRVAKNAKILAIDISSENIRLAKALFQHPNIVYSQVDVITDPIEGEGEWDLIVFPDVYEHIPKESRPTLHNKLNKLLSKKGKIFLTIPSPGKQAHLYSTGKGLQVVDEVVTLEDLVLLSNDVKGVLSYFGIISVWNTNDYIHVIVERGVEQIGEITSDDKLPIKSWKHPNGGKIGLLYSKVTNRIQGWWRQKQVSKALYKGK